MKKYGLTFVAVCFCLLAVAQDIYKITYVNFREGNEASVTSDSIVAFADRDRTVVTKQSIFNGKAKYSYEESFVNISSKLIYKKSTLQANQHIFTVDSTAYNRYNYTLTDEKVSKFLKFRAKKANLSINSNSIELIYTTDLQVNASPLDIGLPLGLILEYRRNKTSGIRAVKVEKIKQWPAGFNEPLSTETVDILTYRDVIWKSKFVQIPVFKNERIRFEPGIKSDSVMRFAEGTVIVKKIKVPEIGSNGQAFIQLIEKSSGDAYDRTGSVFLIAEDQKLTFLNGMKDGMNTLPKYEAGDGKDYVGMYRTTNYSPIYELMRFFTPFGVTHFNKNLKLKDKVWQDSVVYRQDISEFLYVISGKEVYIGVYIGNYDKGGHTVNLEMTVHRGTSNYGQKTNSISLFNTTNVMEMGGQTYATLFGQEKGLEFDFELDKDIKNSRLRYITTGHGGWWNGDEFVPKVNSIYLDGKLAFSFTPWRVDCGSYRLYNPASGNFEDGLSSSDLSRSNWCPGTITYPNYIDLGDLKAGKHKIRVHIPQGPAEGSSFSFWNVSGALLFDK